MNVGNEMIYNKYGNVLNTCTMDTVFLVIFLTISISISSVFIYFYWYFKKILKQLIEYINEK